METSDAKQKIISLLVEKTNLKQRVYQNVLSTFKVLNQVAKNLVEEYNEELKNMGETLALEFKEKSELEIEIHIASDVLVFNMHSNIFDFDKSHKIWETPYAQSNLMSTYSGIISIYNFLYDSFRLNRQDDLGYLIGRIFINKDKHFFMEGKRQLGFLYDDFSNAVIDTVTIRKIVESIILYTLDFDLYVPPYEKVTSITVAQILKKANSTPLRTGKRVGYKFYVDSEGMGEEA